MKKIKAISRKWLIPNLTPIINSESYQVGLQGVTEITEDEDSFGHFVKFNTGECIKILDAVYVLYFTEEDPKPEFPKDRENV